MGMLKKQYREQVVPALREKFGYKNINQVPKLEKVIVNCTTRDTVTNAKVVDQIASDLAAMTGQKPIVTRAKKSIASFKVREGMPMGAAVTLRGDRMYEFLERLIHISLPRVRDFRGISSKAFDGRGNYTLGVKEQIIFPEVEYDKIDKVRGIGVSIVTTAKNNEEGRELLAQLGMPFRA